MHISRKQPDLLELIADVQLVRVEEEENEVTAGGEPAADVDEVVGPLDSLLLS